MEPTTEILDTLETCVNALSGMGTEAVMAIMTIIDIGEELAPNDTLSAGVTHCRRGMQQYGTETSSYGFTIPVYSREAMATTAARRGVKDIRHYLYTERMKLTFPCPF